MFFLVNNKLLFAQLNDVRRGGKKPYMFDPTQCKLIQVSKNRKRK